MNNVKYLITIWLKQFQLYLQSDTLTYYSKYTEKELLPVMRKMACLVQKAGAGKLTAIYTKYKSSKFMRISVIPELQSQVVQDLSEGKL